MEHVIYYNGIGRNEETYFFNDDQFRELCINELGLSANLTVNVFIAETGAIIIDNNYIQNNN